MDEHQRFGATSNLMSSWIFASISGLGVSEAHVVSAGRIMSATACQNVGSRKVCRAQRSPAPSLLPSFQIGDVVTLKHGKDSVLWWWENCVR